MRQTSAVRLIPIFVFAATFVAFLPALSNFFVNWDDTANFLNNPHFRGLGPSQIRWMFTNFHLGHYQPVSWLTLGLDYLIWGMNPFGYHLTNLLLHCLNAVQFYFIALRLLSAADEEFSSPLLSGAVFSALFFSLHPLRVESVAWATERRDVLSAFFYLATIQAYLKGSKAALVFYPLALLSKVTAITLPVVLVIMDLYPLKKKTINLSEKLPFFLMALYTGVIGMLAQAASPALVPMADYGLADRLAQALRGLPFYLWKTLIPLSLSPWYGESYLKSEKSMAAAVLCVAIAASLCFFMRRRQPYFPAAGTCYAVMVFPSLGIVKSGRQIVADRFSYLPCLVWALLAGAAVGYFLRRSRFKTPMTAISLAYVFILGGLTWRQTQKWHDTTTLWTHALSLSPDSSFIQMSLIRGLIEEGRYAQALGHIERQLAARPGPEITRSLSIAGARAHNNIGVDFAGLGKWTEAIAEYQKALRLDPGSAEIHNNLGVLLFQSGDIRGAVSHYEQALRINPNFSPARENLKLIQKK